MNNVELSRRVAKLMHTAMIAFMDVDAKIAFVNEVANAKSFKDLSEDAQMRILSAEQTVKKL